GSGDVVVAARGWCDRATNMGLGGRSSGRAAHDPVRIREHGGGDDRVLADPERNRIVLGFRGFRPRVWRSDPGLYPGDTGNLPGRRGVVAHPPRYVPRRPGHGGGRLDGGADLRRVGILCAGLRGGDFVQFGEFGAGWHVGAAAPAAAVGVGGGVMGLVRRSSRIEALPFFGKMRHYIKMLMCVIYDKAHSANPLRGSGAASAAMALRQKVRHNSRVSRHRARNRIERQSPSTILVYRLTQPKIAAHSQRCLQLFDSAADLKQTKPILAKSVPYSHWLCSPHLVLHLS